MYYIDYPGRPEADTRSPQERLIESFTEAVEEAMTAYRSSDTPLVEVMEYPTLRRVASVRGPRLRPHLFRERNY